MEKFLKYWLPVIIWAGIIFYLSSQPGLKSGLAWPYDFILRKGGHIFEYAILFLLFDRALKNQLASSSAFVPPSQADRKSFFAQKNKKALFWAFLLTILYAISDEYHQTFVAQRVGSWSDVTIDSFGVMLIVWWKIRRVV